MATSVKIRDQTKKELERLQAKILLETNKKYSQQDLIEIMINLSQTHFKELLAITQTRTLTKESFDKVMSLSKSWGVKTDPEQIDDVVYGDD